MTQSITMASMLRKNGHEVVSVLIGKSQRRVIPAFYFHKIETSVTTYESPNFIVDKEQKGVRIFKTIIYNLKRFGIYRKSMQLIHAEIRKHRPDIIVNFYDLLAGLYFFLYNPRIPHICLGHQFLVFHPQFVFPKNSFFDRLMLRVNTYLSSLRATKRLALSFVPMPHLLSKKIFVVPPLLRNEVLHMQPEDKNYILAYILNDGYRKEITAWHENNKAQVVHFFSDSRNDIDKEEIHENLYWHKINDVLFLEYMRNCTAFASTAGFESICEAMYLGKPIMMVPTGGHFEQECNAIDACKAGAGITAKTFDLTRLIQYIPSHDREKSKKFRTWAESAEEQFMHYLLLK